MAVSSLNRRIKTLETEHKFQLWLGFERFIEGLSNEQLEQIALYWRFPDPLPEPLPPGMSRLDGLDRKSLMKLWKESERRTARLRNEMRGRSPDECRFYLDHEHWPEQACTSADCRKQGLEIVMKQLSPAPASKYS
jgi:hypothetical protein